MPDRGPCGLRCDPAPQSKNSSVCRCGFYIPVALRKPIKAPVNPAAEEKRDGD